jgi:hypothetical protein
LKENSGHPLNENPVKEWVSMFSMFLGLNGREISGSVENLLVARLPRTEAIPGCSVKYYEIGSVPGVLIASI